MINSNSGIAAISRRCVLLLLPLCLVLAASGCGIRGELVQKGKLLPSAPVNPTVQQQGNDALLSWTIPTANQDGTVLDNLQQFLVVRLTYRPGDYCEECRDPGTGQIHIYLDRPEPAIRIKDRLYLRDSNLPLNQGYRYRIVPINARGESGAEILTHRVMLPAPQPPSALQAVTLDRSLRIKWVNTSPPDQGQLLGVNIYRAVGDTPFKPQPLNSEPFTDELYNDFGLENGQAYRYGLRSVIRIDDQVIESAVSESVTATPNPEF